MLLADVNLTWVEIVSIATAAFAVIGGISRMLIASKDKAFADMQAYNDKALAEKDRQIEEQKEFKKSYQEMAREAVNDLDTVATEKAKLAKRKRPLALARVIPEHHSPTTEKQRDAAELQTVRAKLVAAKHDLGLPPREESPAAVEAKPEEKSEDQPDAKQLEEASKAKPDENVVMLTDEKPKVVVIKQSEK